MHGSFRLCAGRYHVAAAHYEVCGLSVQSFDGCRFSSMKPKPGGCVFQAGTVLLEHEKRDRRPSGGWNARQGRLLFQHAVWPRVAAAFARVLVGALPGLDSYLSAMTLARKTAAHAVGLWRSLADAAHVRLFPLVDGMVEDHLGRTPQLMAIGIEGSARSETGRRCPDRTGEPS